MYKVRIDFPNLTKGAEVQIDGLGVFENGAEHDVSDAEHDAYRVAHSFIEDELDDKGNVVSRKLSRGSTLLEAFKNTDAVTVTVKSGKSKEPDISAVEVRGQKKEGGAS